MIHEKKVIVVLPAYNAAKTLEKTYNEIDFNVVDDVILVDDNSKDDTVEVAKRIGINHILRHDRNYGYGGNQKTCYNYALKIGADIVIMLHPDYQYNPKLIPSMAYLIAKDVFQVVLGSRILGDRAMINGMPVYKYIANRILTWTQNFLIWQKLSEYHTGYRAFSKEILEKLNLQANPTILFLITRCCARSFISVMRSVKYLARQNILKKLLLSTLAEAQNMGWSNWYFYKIPVK
jgi:glycosyltransferase involved in cell wall biosynthesis